MMCTATMEKLAIASFLPCSPHAVVYHLISGPTVSWVPKPFFWAPDQRSGFQKIHTQYDQNWNNCAARNLLLRCVPFLSDPSHLSEDSGSHSWFLPTPHPPSPSSNWVLFSVPLTPACIYLYLSASPAPTLAPESGCHTYQGAESAVKPAPPRPSLFFY